MSCTRITLPWQGVFKLMRWATNTTDQYDLAPDLKDEEIPFSAQVMKLLCDFL